MAFNKNYLGHEFILYHGNVVCGEDRFYDHVCIICSIRIEYNDEDNDYAEVTETIYVENDFILNCEEYQIKKLLE